MTTLLRAGSLALLAAGTLALGACGGGDDGGDDDKQIAEAIKTGVVTKDLEEKCVKTVTTAFVKRVYGDVENCRKAETPDGNDGKPATGVTVGTPKLDGDKGTVAVTLRGGDSEGAKGTISVAKEDGSWRVDDLGPDLLRSQLSTQVQRAGATRPGFEDAAARTCFLKTFNGYSDAEAQRVAYGAIAESEAAQAQLTKILTDCQAQGEQSSDSSGSAGGASGDDDGSSSGSDSSSGDDDAQSVSFLRRKFEEGLTRSAKRQGATAAQINCVKKELRKTITDDEIIAQVKRSKPSTELTAKAATAIQGCRSETS